MNITAQMVMELRKRTGVGMSKCKESLVEAAGNMEEAIHILRKKGMASAVKKGGRETNEGVITICEHSDGAYLIEVNVETDFVIQNDRFKEFLKNISSQVVSTKPQTVEEFLKQKYVNNDALTIDDYRSEIVHSLGENIQIRRLLSLKKSTGTSLGLYSHMGGKIVCAVMIDGSDQADDVARSIAMHIAAESPDYLDSSKISQDVLKQEEDIARSQVQNKPPEIMDKIIQGKMKAFYEQSCLLHQKFVKDSSMTVSEYLSNEGKGLNASLEISDFIRWQIGE